MIKSLRHVLISGTALFSVALIATGCSGKRQGGSGNSASNAKNSVALVTDVGGISDHSFNQSAWRGMTAYGKEHNIKQGKNGYQYFQSSTQADFVPNFNQAARAGYQTIFGVGFSLKQAVASSAKKYPKQNFVIIDDIIKGQKNVVSVNFKSEDASYLAGVAAAATTKTNTVGFIGGVKSDVIDLFDAGYTKGVQDEAKKLGKKITILNQYIGSFTAADTGKAIASSMYAKGADVIFHAAGPAGDGLFSEAKALDAIRPESKKVWAIGVDSDQSRFGKYKNQAGKDDNCVLSSVITGVNVAVKDISDQAYNGHFPGGKNMIYGLKSNGVALLKGQLSDKAWSDVQAARQQIISGKIMVPLHPAKN